MIARMLEVLLVEDSPSDARLTREAFLEGKIGNNLTIVGDGETALAYLKREGPWNAAVRPEKTS